MDEHHLGKRQSLSQQMTLNRDREFLQQLKADYCQILLRYFNNDNTVKQQIDRFINVAFDAKVPCLRLLKFIWN